MSYLLKNARSQEFVTKRTKARTTLRAHEQFGGLYLESLEDRVNPAGLLPDLHLQLLNPTIAEGGSAVTVRAQVTGLLTALVGVDLNIDPGSTATHNVDYTLSTQSFNILPGLDPFVDITLTPIDDSVYDPNETIGLNVSTSVLGILDLGADVSINTTIIDNDVLPLPTVGLNLLNASFAENGGTATVRLQLAGVAALPVPVSLSIGAQSTATLGTDFSISGQVFDIPAGTDTFLDVTLTGINDNIVDPDETVVVQISALGLNANLGLSNVVSLTIQDDDVLPLPLVNLDLLNTSFAENGGTATLRVSLAGTALLPVPVTLSIGGQSTATLGVDYTMSTQSVNIPAGTDTFIDVTFTGLNDAIVEPNETIAVQISALGVNANLGLTTSVTLNILDDDVAPLPTVSLQLLNPIFNENGGVATIRVQLNGTAAQPVAVSLTIGGQSTATLLSDYTISSQTVNIPAGTDTFVDITLTGVDDALVDVDETVVVQLASIGANAQLGATTSVTATINDDDVLPLPTINLNLLGGANASIQENGGTTTIRAQVTGLLVSVLPITINVAAQSSATLNADFTISSQTLNLPIGLDSFIDFTVTGLDDLLVDPNETIVLQIGSIGIGGQLGLNTSVNVNIVDDDVPQLPTVSLSLFSNPLPENGGTTTIRAQLNGTAAQGVPVTLVIGSQSTATLNSDFTISTQSFTIPAGTNTFFDITLTGLNDSISDPNEIVELHIGSVGSNASIGSSNAVTVSLLDDDPLPLPTVNLNLFSNPLPENGGSTVLRVQLTGTAAQPVAVTLAIGGQSTATMGSDFSISSQSFNIPAGTNTFFDVTLTGIDDLAFDPNESIVVQIGSLGANAAFGATSTVIVNVLDNETAPLPTVGLSLFGNTINENGGTTTLRGQLTGTSTEAVVVTLSVSQAGTALLGTDFSISTMTLTIPAGTNTFFDVTLTAIDDNAHEPNETIIVQIAGISANAALGGSSSVDATILDDDLAILTSPINGTLGADTFVLTPAVEGNGILVTLNGVVLGRYISPNALTINCLTGDDTVNVNASVTLPLIVNGDEGNDTITTALGADLINGGDGNDLIFGSNGNDTMLGGAGVDLMFGQDGNDSMSGQDGNDSFDGGDGNDTLVGDTGNDFIVGNSGDDSILGSDGDDRIDAGIGNDFVNSEAGRDFIFGGEGNDILFGGADSDSIDAGAGNDSLIGGTENDYLFGVDGNDTMMGQDGNDGMDGGTGNDSMLGGNGNDLLFGSFGDDMVSAEAGNDSLNGDAGNDTLIGGTEHDLIFSSGGGNDWVFGGDGNDTLQNIDSNATVLGESGNDLLYGAQFLNDSLLGDAGDDSIFGLGGNDSIFGDAGNDLIFGDGTDASGHEYTGNDWIVTGQGHDVVDCGSGADICSDISGDDLMYDRP